MLKLGLYYFFFLAFLLLIFASGAIESQDGFLYAAVARNIYYKGEPTAPFYDWSKPARENNNIPLNVYKGRDGKTYTRTGLGFSLLLLPAVTITDLVYKFYGVSPPLNFPLESDWLILMFASMTNSFVAAALGVVVFSYLLTLGLNKKQSLVISFVMLFSTNIFILSKSTLAHLMFTLFAVLTFYLIKQYSIKKNKNLLTFAGVSFGIVSISYNMTFLLIVPPLILYYLLLVKTNTRLRNLSSYLIGYLPSLVIFLWFENVRQEAGMSFGGRDVKDVLSNLIHIPPGVFFEGLHGQLFSPGRSLFLYSPIFIIPLLFWNKIKKKILPETLVFVFLTIIYVFFYATQYQVIKPEYGITGFWHGEVSWGPRYLTVLIPFGILIVGIIYKYLSVKTRLLFFLPLVFLGVFVQVLAVVIPYQTKFRGLDQNFFVNGTYHPVEIYSNFLPRYSPILVMSKNLIHLVKDFPKTVDNGIYNVKFLDGVDFPFSVGNERWRTIEEKGIILFDNKGEDSVKTLSLGIINHPNIESSSSAKVNFTFNGNKVAEITFKPSERQTIETPIENQSLKDKENILLIESTFDPPIKTNDQILVMNAFNINNRPMNIESLNYPFVSDLGPATAGAKYQNYGGNNKDPWRFWDIHTQIYERTPDFWWIKPLFYWDLPKNLFALLFLVNASGIAFFGYLTFRKCG